MQEKTEPKGKKKGFFAMLKESIIKSNEGCGPGCGCHAAAKKAQVQGTDTAKVGKKV
ncbi:MAG: hypothetical protein H7831_18965 [Magnetococcus sp. WYHC-3]